MISNKTSEILVTETKEGFSAHLHVDMAAKPVFFYHATSTFLLIPGIPSFFNNDHYGIGTVGFVLKLIDKMAFDSI